MRGSSFVDLLTASFFLFVLLPGSVHAVKKSYIVYLGGHSHGPDPSPSDLEAASNSHYDFLSSVLGSQKKAKEALFYSYNRHINGFAARLEEEEAEEIAKNPNVMSVFLDKAHQLHTTRSWEFLGLDKQGILPAGSAWKKARFGEDTIIANIDTGVWPESESFSDTDKQIGPVPAKWRGACQIDKFHCNRKLIGARFFNLGYLEATGNKLNGTLLTARDYDGHGSHTLSIAGGNFVANATVLRQGNGTAKGGSPRAHLVAYKACWGKLCYDADQLNAFDHAIHDGVDVISVPLGAGVVELINGISIGAFHAVAKNIVVVASAGNLGPVMGTVSNVAPWVFTVAASTIDRQITSNFAFGRKNQTTKDARIPNIFTNGTKTYLATKPAPEMAGFSSVGPNFIQPLLLKPDITAPGVDIIGAYSVAATLTSPIPEVRGSPFNILRGTSQACSHIAGVAGLLKTLHPDWSPAAIKSAIMTTATTLDNTNRRIRDSKGRKANPFNYGAGHVQPNFAMDPGLVYNLSTVDYLNYLCASNYPQNVIKMFNYNKPYPCPKSFDLANFNYPSITVRRSETNPVTVTRNVTNVGPAGTYFVKTDGDKGLQISVNPRSLTFKNIEEKKTFQVTVKVSGPATVDVLFGELLWTNGKQKVRSPVVVL